MEETIDYKGKKIRLRWRGGGQMPTLPRSQARGYIFNEAGEVLIVQVNEKFWSTVGGHAEGNETPQETFEREVTEEVCVEIDCVTPLGMIEVLSQDGQTLAHQARFAARAVKVLPFVQRSETTQQKFVKPAELAAYIPWTADGKVFAEEMKAALAAREGFARPGVNLS